VVELFSLLNQLSEGQAVTGFVPRISDVPGSLDKIEALQSLQPAHCSKVEDLGFEWSQLKLAEQVHGSHVEVVTAASERESLGADGLLTLDPQVLLGIYVADCGLIWLRDRETGALGLLHSGKKGTELNILAAALKKMEDEFGTRVENVTGLLGPCIRPPHYEVDFAATIRRNFGIAEFVLHRKWIAITATVWKKGRPVVC